MRRWFLASAARPKASRAIAPSSVWRGSGPKTTWTVLVLPCNPSRTSPTDISRVEPSARPNKAGSSRATPISSRIRSGTITNEEPVSTTPFRARSCVPSWWRTVKSARKIPTSPPIVVPGNIICCGGGGRVGIIVTSRATPAPAVRSCPPPPGWRPVPATAPPGRRTRPGSRC